MENPSEAEESGSPGATLDQEPHTPASAATVSTPTSSATEISRQQSAASICSSMSKDEALCRVCRCGEEAGPLYYPCKCKGSIRFVHEDCLVEWLRVSHKRSCELCLTEFEFKSVYHDNTPQRLSSLEVLIGTLQLSLGYVPLMLQGAAVLVIWAGIFPLFTIRVHTLYFSRRRTDVWAVLADWDIQELPRECILGVFLSAWIVVAFLVLMVLQDLASEDDMIHGEARQHLDHRNIAQFADRVVERAVAAAADANDLVDEIEAANEENRLMELGNRIFREHVGQNLNLRGLLNENLVHQFPGAALLHVDDEVALMDDEIHAEPIEAGDEMIDNGPHVVDPWVDAQLPGANGIPDVDLARGAGPEEDMAWDALIGLRGGARGLRRGVYTMILVSLGNIGFLFFFQFLPFLVGRVVIKAAREYTLGDSEPLDNLHLIGIGYGAMLCGVSVYLLLNKLHDIWLGRSTVPAPDIVTKYAVSVVRAVGEMLGIAFIMLFELLILEIVVGTIVHIGCMGVSGDTMEVLWARAELCHKSPMTCAFIHWAMGSVLIANWSAVIWAFRQIVHPRFKVRFFEGWYDATKNIEMGIFGPIIDRHRRELEEQNRLWQERIATVTMRIASDQSNYAQSQGVSSPQADDNIFEACMNQAPVAGPETGDLARVELVSRTLEECLSYVSTVVLWCVPAVLVFLVIPIHLIKTTMPSLLPIRIGSFRQPFADAQLPLDMFFFHSLPYVIERLDLNRLLLQASRQVALLLTYPLDLHGYVLKPILQHMHTGFVFVDATHSMQNSASALASLQSSDDEDDIPEEEYLNCELAVRSGQEDVPDAVRSLNLLSRREPGETIDFLGMVCQATSWMKFAPQIMRKARASLEGHGEEMPPMHVFSVTDVHGYCVPVFLSSNAQREILALEEIPNEDLLGKILQLREHFAEEVIAKHPERDTSRMQSIRRRLLREFVRDDEDLSRCPSKNVVAILRNLREVVQDKPELVDALVDLMPEGFGVQWTDATAVSLLGSLRRIVALWRDGNAAPVVAIRNAKVSGENGRSLELDLDSLILLEPDAGAKAELCRICFQARQVESTSMGQFCVLRHEPLHLSARLRVLAVLAFFAAVLASFTALVLPLVVGRFAFGLIGDPLKHDVYHWGGGVALLWFFGMLGRWFFTAVFGKDGGWRRALHLCGVWTMLAWKWFVAFIVFGICIPVLTGILFDLVVLDPYNTPVDRTPVNLIFQDWALGLALLKAWTRLVLLGVIGSSVWADRIERVQNDGGYGIRLRWTLWNVAAPLLNAILFRICTPYVIARLLQVYLELDPISAEAVMRYSFPAFSVLLLLYDFSAALASYGDVLHDRIRDKRYMVGRQLQNR